MEAIGRVSYKLADVPARRDVEKRKVRARKPIGMLGTRGKTGTPGTKGPKGPKPPLQKHVLDIIVTQFEDVYRELNDHLRRIAKIQQQVNELFTTVRRLSKP